jgi:hypothetical protein
MSSHATVVCERINSSAHFHTKSWSFRFDCPTCGKWRRYNTNFLGSRYRLVCDGQTIQRVHRDESPDYDPTPYELDTSAESGAETLERGMREARRVK